MKIRDVDFWRKTHLAVAEAVDTWRIVPRSVAAGYAYIVWSVVDWYMGLRPYLPEEFLPLLKEAKDAEMIAAIGTLMVIEPSTQHSFLVTTIVTLSAAVFAFYVNTGKKWNGFVEWHKPKEPEIVEKNIDREIDDMPIPKPPVPTRKRRFRKKIID